MSLKPSYFRGQAIAEYVVLLGLVAAALWGMNVYVKRGIQGTVKRVADTFSAQSDAERKSNRFETITNSTQKQGLNVAGGILTTQYGSGSGGDRSFISNSVQTINRSDSEINPTGSVTNVTLDKCTDPDRSNCPDEK